MTASTKTDKTIRIAAYFLAGISFVPFIGVPIGLIAILLGLFFRRHGGKKLALVGAAGISLTFVLIFSIAVYLLHGVPSIYEKVKPFCQNKNSYITGEYLEPDLIPASTRAIFEVAENANYAVVKILNDKMRRQDDGMMLWHLRGMALTLWVTQYKDSELMAYYLNRAYFGERCEGIDAAAKFYFKKGISSLSLEETSELIALLKAPKDYSITEHPDENKKRAAGMIKAMADKAASQESKAP